MKSNRSPAINKSAQSYATLLMFFSHYKNENIKYHLHLIKLDASIGKCVTLFPTNFCILALFIQNLEERLVSFSQTHSTARLMESYNIVYSIANKIYWLSVDDGSSDYLLLKRQIINEVICYYFIYLFFNKFWSSLLFSNEYILIRIEIINLIGNREKNIVFGILVTWTNTYRQIAKFKHGNKNFNEIIFSNFYRTVIF